MQGNEGAQIVIAESEPKKIKLIVVGDSHAGMYRHYADKLVGRKNTRSFTYPGCPPINGVTKVYNKRGFEEKTVDCEAAQTSWGLQLSLLKNNVILISSRWEFHVRDQVTGYQLKRQDWLVNEEGQSLEMDLDKEKTRKNVQLGLANMIRILRDNKVLLMGQVPLQFGLPPVK